MPTPLESRAALVLLTGSAVDTAQRFLASTSGSPEARRFELLGGVPEVISYYTDGSAALAADFYSDQREIAGITSAFVPELIVTDRVVKIRRAIAWAAEPLFGGDEAVVPARLAEVVQLESARAFRDTVTGNRQADPDSIGWRRIAAGGCKLCRMLADRGSVYRESTARFAAHANCHCTAQPVFRGEHGTEASAMQYKASLRSRTPAQRAELRAYLDAYY